MWCTSSEQYSYVRNTASYARTTLCTLGLVLKCVAAFKVTCQTLSAPSNVARACQKSSHYTHQEPCSHYYVTQQLPIRFVRRDYRKVPRKVAHTVITAFHQWGNWSTFHNALYFAFFFMFSGTLYILQLPSEAVCILNVCSINVDNNTLTVGVCLWLLGCMASWLQEPLFSQSNGNIHICLWDALWLFWQRNPVNMQQRQ